MEKIAGLWRSEPGKKSVMSGQPSGLLKLLLPPGSRIVILKNEKKEGKQPDYEVFVGTDDATHATRPTTKDEDPPF